MENGMEKRWVNFFFFGGGDDCSPPRGGLIARCFAVAGGDQFDLTGETGLAAIVPHHPVGTLDLERQWELGIDYFVSHRFGDARPFAQPPELDGWGNGDDDDFIVRDIESFGLVEQRHIGQKD